MAFAASIRGGSRQRSRSEWWLVAGGVAGAAAALIGLGILVRAADVPRVAIPTPSPLPSPNAFDVFQRAASLTTGECGEITMGIRPEPSATEHAQIVRRNRMALDTFRAGFDFPYRNPSARTYNPNYTHLVSFAELSQTAVWEARYLWKQRQTAAAAETCLDLIRFGMEIPRGGRIRHLLTGLSIEDDGQEVLWKMRGELPADLARTVARELYQVESQRVSYADILEEARWTALSVTLELYRSGKLHHTLNGAGASNANTPPAPWWENMGTSLALAPVAPRQVIAKMTAYLDAQIEQAKRPYAPMPPAIPRPEDPVNRLMLSTNYHGVHIAMRENEMKHRLLTLTLALQAYRAEKGDCPAQLGQLVSSGYLSGIPQDPFTQGEPLRYRRLSSGRYLLYSVGPDAQDDRGMPVTNKSKPVTGTLNAQMTGDFVVGKNTP